MIEYTRIIKICNMYFEIINPNQSLSLTRTFSLKDAERLACKGYLSSLRLPTTFSQIPIKNIRPSKF